MHIAFGCDHRGLDLKQDLIDKIIKMGHSYEDFGSFSSNPIDYPDIALLVARAVTGENCNCGVLICSTGIGMSIAANKVKGIRAALCHNIFTTTRTRRHNDANILCLGAEVVDNKMAEEILKTFLETEFEGGRHTRRIEKIQAMESPEQDDC